MWLFTKYGFFSIVQKKPGEFHVRARNRHDLEALREAVALRAPGVAVAAIRRSLPIIDTPYGDYGSRIIITSLDSVARIFDTLGESITYDNFKSEIARTPAQADKLHSLHDIWSIIFAYQNRLKEKARLNLGHLAEVAAQKATQELADCPQCEGEGEVGVNLANGEPITCDACSGHGQVPVLTVPMIEAAVAISNLEEELLDRDDPGELERLADVPFLKQMKKALVEVESVVGSDSTREEIKDAQGLANEQDEDDVELSNLYQHAQHLESEMDAYGDRRDEVYFDLEREWGATWERIHETDPSFHRNNSGADQVGNYLCSLFGHVFAAGLCNYCGAKEAAVQEAKA
jgi:hypothetical protein